MSGLSDVSVIIPSYGRPVFLERAIQSALEQTIPPREVLVIDDCSSKPLQGQIETSGEDTVVKFIRHKENKGVSEARNTGLEAAKGEFIAFLDDDDYWTKDKLERQLRDIHQSEAGLSYTGYNEINEEGAVINKSTPATQGEVTRDLLFQNPVSISSVLVDVDVARKAGEFQDIPWEDWEWLIRVSEETKFSVVSLPLTVHQRGETHIQRSGDINAKRERYLEFMKNTEDTARGYGQKALNRHKSQILFTLGKDALSTGQQNLAYRKLKQALSYNPNNWKAYILLIASILGHGTYSRVRRIKRLMEGLLPNP